MKVLTITTEPDPHLDFVRQKCSSEFVVLDPYRFPEDFGLTFTLNGVGFVPSSSNLRLEGINTIWHRKPHFKENTEFNSVQKKYRKMVRSAYYNFLTEIYALMRDRLWVSDWWAIKKAESKLYQLEMAKSLGISIPETIVTNDPSKAHAFRSQHQRIVVKTLSDELVEEREASYALFTSRVDPNEDFDGLDINPSIFQREIAGGLDIRVTVVGDEVFPAQIIKLNDLVEESDWRLGIGTSNFLIKPDENFPDKLKNQCRQLVSILGLKFGAIDFIKDSEGKYWFLEINPNGQWLFVEEMSGIPISDAFVRLFQSPV